MVKFSSLFALVAGFQLVKSHFLLQYPGNIGFEDDKNNIAPCGGFDVDFSRNNITDFHVGGDTVVVQTIHPTTQWLFRATLDKTAGGNWTNLLPVIVQNAIGYFCELGVQVPPEWAGSQGVLQVVSDAVDGLLYQCAAVNFVEGLADSVPGNCRNATGLTASFGSDPVLSAIPSGTASATSMSPSETASSSSSATATATAKAAAASTYAPHDALGAFLWVGMAALGVATALVYL